MNKKNVRLSVLLVVLAALLVVAGTALAADPPPPLEGTCGTGANLANGLLVKKGVDCAKERSLEWVIEKIADATDLILSPGQSFTVNYEVTTSAEATDKFDVSGNI